MTLTEKLESVQYVTDAEGNRQAVLLSLSVWEEILALVESLEEAETDTRRKHLIAEVNESRQAYESGEVRRGTVDDFMAEMDD
jgi:hypothetical protein